jgi:multidrug efflux system outer membrane protein
MTKSIYAVLPCLFLLSACNVGPEYRPPVIEVPDQWKNETSDATSPRYENASCWWEIFQDETLNQLEELAVFNNQDIRSAVARVKLEWALAGVAGADLFPQLHFEPRYRRTRQLVNSFTSGLPLPITLPKDFVYRQTEITLPFTASYMVDFWQKNWHNFEAGVFTAESQEEALRMTVLTITTDLASRYFQYRSFIQQLVYLEDAIKVREEAVKINSDRFKAGLISEIDVVQAQAELSSAIAQKKDTIRLKGLTEDIIAVLTGQLASEFCLDSLPLLSIPPTIPAGIPSGMLLRRPDIAQAERAMASANEEIGVAAASFYPDITLSAAFGTSSPTLHQLFTQRARYWTYGVNIDQILFDGNRLYSNWVATVAQYEQTEAQYKQTILRAFQEVEDSLISIKENRERREALVDTVRFNERSVELAQNRYFNGLVNYLEVEIQMRNLLQSQLNQQQVLAEEYIALIDLIRSLGGGWCSCPN